MAVEVVGLDFTSVLKGLATVNFLGWISVWFWKNCDEELTKLDVGLVEIFTPSAAVLVLLLFLEAGI